jgi:type I site-specific restriction endonuclease
MEQINQTEKTLVFCATQAHALTVRDQEKLTPLLRLKYHNSIADAVLS